MHMLYDEGSAPNTTSNNSKKNNSSNVLFIVFPALYIYYLICFSERMRKWGLTNMPKMATGGVSPWDGCEAHASAMCFCIISSSLSFLT